MPLTTWEGLKVGGHAITKFAEKAEQFEDANPGQKYSPKTSDIVNMVVETLAELGVEVAD